MEAQREGGCQCGSLRYSLSAEPLVVAACHCTDCQRQSGSAFGMTMVVERGAFSWLRGEARTFTTTAASGARKECVFCPACGTRIYNALESLPATVNVKPGTLDDTSWFAPSVHTWLSCKQPWTPVPERGERFDHNPPLGDRRGGSDPNT